MIATVEGKIAYIGESFVVVETGGIGYKVFTTAFTLGKIASLESVRFFTYTHIREDIFALYGFLERSDLEMFELLISVSGIGPKAALGILSIADARTVRTAILNKDASILTRVSGIGKKTAERVILELQGKVADLGEVEKSGISSASEAMEALGAMGYSAAEAREALSGIPKEVTDTGEKIKYALRGLGKKK